MAIEYKSHTEVSEKLLNRSLENLRELALYTVSTDTSVIEELDTLANSINAEFSLILINETIILDIKSPFFLFKKYEIGMFNTLEYKFSLRFFNRPFFTNVIL